MRIGLIGDTNGYVPPLETAIAGCRAVADLILGGHMPYPLVQRTALPNGRAALVIRGAGFFDRWTDYVLLTHVGAVEHGFKAWEISRRLVAFQPRDPTWQWDQPSRKTRGGGGE